MRRIYRLSLLVGLFFGWSVFLLPPCSQGGEAQKKKSLATLLKDTRKAAWSKTAPPPYTLAKQDAARQLIRKTLQPTAKLKIMQAAWQPFGMSLTVLSASATTLWIIKPAAVSQSGRGFLAIRRGQARPVFLQAPHSRFDRYTGKIVGKLFARFPFRAAMWNACPRKQRDATHFSPSLLEAAASAFVQFAPQGRVIQVHGYTQKQRETEAGKNAEAIVSAGSLFVTPSVRSIHKRLRKSLGWRAALFPSEVSELGARANFQGKALRKAGSLGFVHLEISLPKRQQLANDSSLRKKLAAICLTSGEGAR